MFFQTNPQLELAFEYIRNTNKNIFLTGKAGTGKTTFLHEIRKEGIKRMAVVAPTGIAAINAGGMTIHSLFQMPFGLFLPGSHQDASRQRKFSRDKIRLIQSLDLLVIDEISMVRADLLDGIDDVLRRYRDYSQPFGGVQLLMIGDLHQLPPVVKDDEWQLLREHYPTPYFFSSHALQKTNPISLELKHIYRQSDATFIELLNKVRDNQLNEEVLNTLNSRFNPGFHPPEAEAWITLTAHNAAAQDINTEKLRNIPGQVQLFKATITGEFPPHAYPTEEILEFKPGAQVMFVKNDISRDKRYYNGKLGQITRIEEKNVIVKCPGEAEEIIVSAVEWGNVKYRLNETSKEITEETIGAFSQLPLKLAWAITIHKSQGLTFERAIIDAQAAFAHGQVYVALSRCKSFEGIVLRSKIVNSSVKTDTVVRNYSAESDKNTPNEAQLLAAKADFQKRLIADLFSFHLLKKPLEQLFRLFLEHENTLHPDGYRLFKEVDAKAETELFSVAAKFSYQLQELFNQPGLPEANDALQARLAKANTWFFDQLDTVLLPGVKSIPIITDNQSVLKLMNEALDILKKEIFVKKACFNAVKSQFSTHAYLRARTNAELDYQQTKPASPATPRRGGVPPGCPHPDLYLQLKSWREDMADTAGLENWEILPSAAMNELTQRLPVTPTALKKIKGIGAVKLRHFGADIIGIITQYCADRHIDTDAAIALPAPDSIPEKAPKIESRQVSFDLLQAGKSIDEIALERGFVRSTVEGHLSYYIGTGQLDILALMEQSKVDTIEAYYREHPEATAKEVREALGEADYSYGEIKMVWQWMKGAEGE